MVQSPCATAIGALKKIAGRTKNQASIEAKCIEKPSGPLRLPDAQ